MKFCDCGNLLVPVIAANTAYFECMVCTKRRDFGPEDTLIKPPVVAPSGHDKVAHITRHMAHKNIFATVSDRPCTKCGYQYAKLLLDPDNVWYGCMADGCGHTYQ